jgi:glycine/D-amino acid oxidase-like deaminating enzyme
MGVGMKTRRQIFHTAGAAACLLWMPAIARRAHAQPGDDALKPLRSKFLLTPDFQHLRKTAQFFAGVRPHRTGGIRLSLNEISTAKGTKFLIHNYGHSGAGITLSWGCASVVRDHVETVVNQMGGTKTHPSVAVLGSGVIGLTVATELRGKWPTLPIVVYAKTLDVSKTTSFIAGGQFEPSQICDEYMGADRPILEDYLKRSARKIKEIENSGRRLEFGVAQRKNYTLASADTAFESCTPHDVVPLPNIGSLPFEKLNVAGREYSTWLMNPRILLPKLIADLKKSSVLFKAKDFTDQQQVMDLNENIIINCTGYGAKKLFCDAALQARRGLIAVLKNPAELKYFFSGGCDNDVIAYMFARQSDIVIGGTVVRNDEREHFDASPGSTDTAQCNRLIDNMQKLFDGHPNACASPPNVVPLPPVPDCLGPGT